MARHGKPKKLSMSGTKKKAVKAKPLTKKPESGFGGNFVLGPNIWTKFKIRFTLGLMAPKLLRSGAFF